MSARLATGGRLIDRARPVGFTFDGAHLTGYVGDTLASALLAGDRVLMGRSFKYHRPRGPLASGVEEPNALMGVGSGGHFTPNTRATTTELREGLAARSQNCWPGLRGDVGAVTDRLARLLPAGFYYKTFIHPRAFWKHVFEPAIRRSAGLGRAPEAADPASYEHFHVHVDVLVVGGGVAGLRAAHRAAAAGAEVLVLEAGPHWGGRAPVDAREIEAQGADDWVRETVAALGAMPNVRLRARTTAAGLYDHGFVLAEERCAGDDGPRKRLWKIRAGHVVVATGAHERPLAFPGNDVPGVVLASAMRDYVVNWAVAPGARTVVVANNDDAYRTALALADAGLEVPALLDARPEAEGALPAAARERGLRVLTGTGIAGVTGRRRVTGVALCAQDGDGAVRERVACDAVAMSGGWSPVVHLWSHSGGKLAWDPEAALFRPDPGRAPVGADGRPMATAAGAANGHLEIAPALADAEAAGLAAAKELGRAPCTETAPVPGDVATTEAPIRAVWRMPARGGAGLRAKTWLDFQNDVKVTDVALAAQEGFESVEHAKRYTTLGMATDQGKLSNVNGLAVLAEVRGEAIPQVGTTTFRPPYTPVTLAAIAGDARGALFKPVRRTPVHDRNVAAGAVWEPVGDWRRPFAYPRPGESREAAAQREALAVRRGVGVLDASTLGKLLVRGPDAGRFLDMIYTGRISTLAEGRCRYALICSENGFLMDDGVVARLGPDTFLCHTTTGGAGRVHAHMEEWLQTEWWDWRVYVADLTEQYAQIGVAGPEARRVLEALGGMDLAEEALPFMRWADGRLAGHDVRVFRVAFSGALSFEIAVRAGEGAALWDKVADAGAAFGIVPYGTEALHILRAEAGLVMIGEETDGTVIPQDLGLDWAVSGKKDDFIGRRAQARAHMTDPERWRLVGLETPDGSVLPEGAYAVAGGVNANGQRNVEGRVTSTYRSPSLGRGIAMGLVRRGPERMGETLQVAGMDGALHPACIVPPAFLERGGDG